MSSAKPESRHRRAALRAALAALATLSACGGDGETAAPPPSPPAPPPIAAPTITTQPQASSAREGEAVTLTVAASSPGEAPSYQWSFGGENISGATSASYTTPPMPFTTTPYSQGHVVKVSNSAGQVLSSAAVASRSALRSWRDVATPLSASLQSEGFSALARDTAGRTHVVSTQSSNGARSVQIHGYGQDSDQDVWSYSHSIAMLAPGNIITPSLSASADGSLMLVWLESYGSAINGLDAVLRAAIYTPNASNPRSPGVWTALDGYVQAPNREAYDATISSSAAGVYDVAFLQSSANPSVQDVQFRRYTRPASGTPSAAGFGPVESLEAYSTPVFGSVAMATHASASLVAFKNFVGGTTTLSINHRAAGAAWSGAAAVDSGLEEPGVREAFIAVSSNGTGMLAVTTQSVGLVTRRINMVTGAWLDAAWAQTSDCGYDSPVLLADGSGNFDMVCTATELGSSTAIKHWRYANASGWGSAGAVLDSSSANIYTSNAGVVQPKAGRDAAGNLVVVYSDRAVGGAQTLRFVRYSVLSGAWTAPAAVDPPAATTLNQQEHALLVDPSGNATVVWDQTETGASARTRWARLR